MRSAAASSASPGVANSQAPPVALARRRSAPSAGEVPTPITNTRCAARLAVAMMASTSQTSPSVIINTSEKPLPGACVRRSLRSGTIGGATAAIPNTAASAASISVPPRLASVFAMSCAKRLRMAGEQCASGDTCSTVDPKRVSDTASASVSLAARPFNARRADSMLSPPIEPEQSTSSFNAMLSRSGASGIGSVARSTVGASAERASCAWVTTASPPDFGVTTSTTSRSRRASGASAISSPASVRRLTTRCVGHSTAASANAPATCSVSASGYSAASDVTGACCGCRPKAPALP